ncbi:TPA: hypothetical protein HA278_07140 [Candidatus Woesearchaeota archaeon]|nr:hypothetical protein [archaeon]HIJ11807.1 hypothetical protein [Candidatus Woesearchaeota archaeon]|tara:strand:- start:1243 stop:1611 length:369 start_codon:yes stop_codon:yes gene_type:complete
MTQIEHNIITSFNLVKEDFAKMHRIVRMLSQNQDKLVAEIQRLKATKKRKRVTSRRVKKATLVRKAAKRVSKKFVSSKTGKKFHDVACPFGKNIKPKNKVHYASKVKALNKGLKGCNCVKTV